MNHIITARPCDEHGNYLNEGTPPPLRPAPSQDDWGTYGSRTGFEAAELLFEREQMSGGNINALLKLWAASLTKHGDQGPFANTKALYDAIDNSSLDNVAWKTFSMNYKGELPEKDIPPWMLAEYDVHFRDPRTVAENMTACMDFEGEQDLAPLHVFDSAGNRQVTNFMEGDWAWRQAVRHPF